MSASHETPILLLLPDGASVPDALRALLDDPEVRHVSYPPLWCLDEAGIDLPAALPQVRSISPTTLHDVFDALKRLCTEEALENLVRRQWRAIDERVRDFYLRRSTLQTVAAILKMGTPSIHRDPPAAFRRDRIYEQGLSIEYRLSAGGPFDPHAPAQEGTVTARPFDPQGVVVRAEAGLSEGQGPVLELFAYDTGRARHRALAQRVARAHPGWQVFDPSAA